ncbi:MAG: 6-phosphogluconate dehydrogenase [Chitinophagaceae bacterium]|nr:6-phosphogluconate dehydrogenase [Chitinophagaceae bacterium]
MEKMTIGWVGLGTMGTPMARNLLNKGFQVCVYNRTREKERELIKLGASSANSLQQLSRISEVVITMVTDDLAVEEVYNGSNGLLADPSPGTLMIDMSTVGTRISKKLAKDCGIKGVRFLEAKVSGSVKPAEEGQLVIMAGGANADYSRALPVFEVLGKRSFHMGEVGIASASKLCLNYFLGLTLQGLAETVLFAQHLNIDTEDILNLLNESALGSGITRLKAQTILSNDYSPAFALKHITKDLTLVQKEGMDFPLFSPLLTSFQRAFQMGYGEQDAISIIRFLVHDFKNAAPFGGIISNKN